MTGTSFSPPCLPPFLSNFVGIPM
uniref:Uncharacterized protein n=1 Tax=Anguilla anguilla TaxID=7936 RepID=A0A0E9PY32_ANGAN